MKKQFLVKFEDITIHPYHFIDTKIMTEHDLTKLKTKDKTLVLETTPGSCSYINYTHDEFDSKIKTYPVSEADIKVIETYSLLFSNCDALEI